MLRKSAQRRRYNHRLKHVPRRRGCDDLELGQEAKGGVETWSGEGAGSFPRESHTWVRSERVSLCSQGKELGRQREQHVQRPEARGRMRLEPFRSGVQDRSRQSPGLVLCSYLSPHPRPGLKADAPCLLQTSEHVDGLGTTGSVLKPQSHHERVSEHQPGTAGRAGDRHRGVLLGLPRSARAPHSPARSEAL